MRQAGLQLEFRCAVVNEQIVVQQHRGLGRQLLIAPFEQDVTGHPQKIGLWITDFTQVPGTQQPQIGLLGEILDVDRRPHTPAEESEQAPIPALLPSYEERSV